MEKLMEHYDKFYKRIRLRHKLYDVNYFKRRYSKLSHQEKIIQKRRDSIRHETATFDNRKINGYLKYKLTSEIVNVLGDIAEDPEAEYRLGLSPTKSYKADTFAELIINNVKSNIAK